MSIRAIEDCVTSVDVDWLYTGERGEGGPGAQTRPGLVGCVGRLGEGEVASGVSLASGLVV